MKVPWCGHRTPVQSHPSNPFGYGSVPPNLLYDEPPLLAVPRLLSPTLFPMPEHGQKDLATPQTSSLYCRQCKACRKRESLQCRYWIESLSNSRLCTLGSDDMDLTLMRPSLRLRLCQPSSASKAISACNSSVFAWRMISSQWIFNFALFTKLYSCRKWS